MVNVNNKSFSEDIKTFYNEHKILCICTLGVALVGYALGNISGRSVAWLSSKCFGPTAKTQQVASEILQNNEQKEDRKDEKDLNDNFLPPSVALEPLLSNDSKPVIGEEKAVANIEEIKNPSPSDLRIITDKILEAYNSKEAPWILVQPENFIDVEKPVLPISAGGVAYEGIGFWKIHISINPEQMEVAIPLITESIYDLNRQNPVVGFKMASIGLLQSDTGHQLGKEFTVIFSEEVEKDTLHGNSTLVKDWLNSLWHKLYNAGIRPEAGLMLTAETRNQIEKAPEGEYKYEKINLSCGKFDRAIPSPKGCQFFYYRDESCVGIKGDMKEYNHPNIMAVSSIMEVAENTPDFAHNPLLKPDPFFNINITENSIS